MTDKQIIIDGLACVNCPEAKRCQEQQAKKEYVINQVLQDIPTEYANVIARLKQIIPSVTRCDYVLEKQLKRKEQECEELKKQLEEESKLGHKAVQEEADTFFDLLKAQKELDQLKKENNTLFKAIEEVNKINKRLETENEELKKELESTKGLVTVGNRQLAEALLELQKYKDREQWEIELNKKRADSFKEMRKMLYGKFIGNSLIEKRSPYEN